MAAISEITIPPTLSTSYYSQSSFLFSEDYNLATDTFNRRFSKFINSLLLKVNLSEEQFEVAQILSQSLAASFCDLSKIIFEFSLDNEIIISTSNPDISVSILVIDSDGDVMIGYTSIRNSEQDRLQFFDYNNFDEESLIYHFLS